MQETMFEEEPSFSFLGSLNNHTNSFSNQSMHDRNSTKENSFLDSSSMIIEDQGKSSKASKGKRAKVTVTYLPSINILL